MLKEAMSLAPSKPANSRKTRILLLLFIISPLAVLTLLCVMIAESIEKGAVMHAPPVGAGAGRTGMSNEFMGIGKERHPKPPTPMAPAETHPSNLPATEPPR